MDRTAVLLLDQEESFRKTIASELSRAGLSVTPVATAAAARTCLARQGFDVVLLDARPPEANGLELLCEIKAQRPATEVVMIDSQGEVQDVVQALRHGAFDVLPRPCTGDQLLAVILQASSGHAPAPGAASRPAAAKDRSFADFVGESHAMRVVRDLITQVAGTRSTVLIRGESGVGKEIVARALHRMGSRSHQPFIVVDCAVLHENLLQSELFGHERGAYTGATT